MVYLFVVNWRADVEELFLWDRYPLEVNEAIYDTNTRQRVHVPLSSALSVRNELRAQLVERIKDAAMMLPETDPFTIVKAHEVIANRDLRLDAVLVRPDFVPLLGKVRRPMFGINLKVFGHDEVLPGDVFCLAEPEFLGRVARAPSGKIGIAVTNAEAIVWGRFPLRRSA